MERRTKLLLIIALAAVLLALGVWYLFQPSFQPAPSGSDDAYQLPVGRQPVKPSQNQPSGTSTPDAATSKSDATLRTLETLSATVVTRIGSGSSMNGFRGYDDVMMDAVPSFRTALRTEQKALQAAHPATGPAFGLLTRVVAVDSRSVSLGAPEATLTLQAQQAEDAGNPSQPTKVSYKTVSVTLQKQSNGVYLVSGIVWKDLER